MTDMRQMCSSFRRAWVFITNTRPVEIIRKTPPTQGGWHNWNRGSDTGAPRSYEKAYPPSTPLGP